MLVIRFLRTGRKNQSFFRIVVTDKNNPPKGGRFLEILGFFNPRTKEKKINQERTLYWISKGAQPSDTIHNLLISEKIIQGDKIDVHKKSKRKEKKEETAPAQGEDKGKEPVSVGKEQEESSPNEEEKTDSKESPQEEKPTSDKIEKPKKDEKEKESVKEKAEEGPAAKEEEEDKKIAGEEEKGEESKGEIKEEKPKEEKKEEKEQEEKAEESKSSEKPEKAKD